MAIKASIAGWALSCLFTPVLAMPAMAQDKGQPPVRVNVLNVCTPGQADTEELGAALEAVPLKPDFAGDYEVARGRSTLQGPSVSRWVRLRYEFPGNSVFGSAQYSFSLEKSGITETLVLLMREPKKIVSVSIEDTVTAGSPAAVLASDTPAGRMRVERFGKSSLVLERCPQANQAAYNDLFRRASDLMRTYRSALGVRKVVTGELEKLQATSASQQPSHPAR
jgi:hypothetical protein